LDITFMVGEKEDRSDAKKKYPCNRQPMVVAPVAQVRLVGLAI
jgi:hypothetical protein